MAFSITSKGPQLCSKQARVPRQHTPTLWMEDPRSALASKCACGHANSVYHSLDCKLCGYVCMRHNAIRDTAAFFLQEEKCKDVRIEPALLPVQPTSFSRKTNTQDEARLDVAAVGLYAPFERTFFDIRVTHLNCDSNTFKP